MTGEKTNKRNCWGEGITFDGERSDRFYHPYTMLDFKWPDLKPKFPILTGVKKEIWDMINKYGFTFNEARRIYLEANQL